MKSSKACLIAEWDVMQNLLVMFVADDHLSIVITIVDEV